MLGIREDGHHDFPSKLFRLTVPKHFVEEPLCVSECLAYRKILCIKWVRGISRFSVRNFLSHRTEKVRRGTLPGFRKILVSKLLIHKRGGGAVSLFSVVIIKLKNVEKGWDSNNTYCFKTLLSYSLCHGSH